MIRWPFAPRPEAKTTLRRRNAHPRNAGTTSSQAGPGADLDSAIRKGKEKTSTQKEGGLEMLVYMLVEGLFWVFRVEFRSHFISTRRRREKKHVGPRVLRTPAWLGGGRPACGWARHRRRASFGQNGDALDVMGMHWDRMEMNGSPSFAGAQATSGATFELRPLPSIRIGM